MKRLIRCVCIIVIIALLGNYSVFAAETDSRASSFFSKHTTYIHIVNTRQFEVWFSVIAVSTMDEIGVSQIEVQRSADGVSWTTMKTFEEEAYPQMMDENSVYHSDCVTYWGTPGYYYRAAVHYYAKNSSGIGVYDTYTNTILL